MHTSSQNGISIDFPWLLRLCLFILQQLLEKLSPMPPAELTGMTKVVYTGCDGNVTWRSGTMRRNMDVTAWWNAIWNATAANRLNQRRYYVGTQEAYVTTRHKGVTKLHGDITAHRSTTSYHKAPVTTPLGATKTETLIRSPHSNPHQGRGNRAVSAIFKYDTFTLSTLT